MKKCEICGAQIKPKFSLCKDCQESKRLPDSLTIRGSFYQDKQLKRLKKEVFIDIPERVAKLLQRGEMGMNKLRTFFCMIRNAHETFSFSEEKNFEDIKPQLWRIITVAEDRKRRKVVPQSFCDFIKLGINIALKDSSGRELYGFVEFFRSIIAYSK
ncbi:CRISPR-associated protein [Candidatus Desulfofervidus auxilii]|uniref:CRISPR system Cms protein Csm2 n=1 Tax=Desulfofervidus auxilii TaxID=1621989 RepID=A0A7U4QKA4_DESA2|nr:type III-A CRISPR-associated protein Csm2 [Candidatus Desulfofervidus auxilii]AMM40917.1 CRISPR-associated protein [Candidatus Desulfofervidus auxilii]CAD7775280.1 hypothetical protein BLFGPEAP_01282 [Candidatus Methanoperedenaceae archaeon GB50]CAD7776795.1 hypothetical protein DMNBHIDG_01363 [Candidatus Methanoperedenaceae archaeon GB37]